MSCALVVPAAGRGERLGAGLPKALVPVAGEPLLVHALRRALGSGVVDVVVVVAPEGEQERVRALLHPLGVERLLVVPGGAERQDSVRSGLAALAEHAPDVDVVLVHDAARALAPPGVFRAVLAAVRAGAVAVVPVVPVADTVKRVDAAGVVVETVDRRELAVVQTPQGFACAPLRAAHEAAAGAAPATDDAGVLEALGHEVRTVPGADTAFKVTRPLDLLLAEALLHREGA